MKNKTKCIILLILIISLISFLTYNIYMDKKDNKQEGMFVLADEHPNIHFV